MGALHSNLDLFIGDDLLWGSGDAVVMVHRHQSKIQVKAKAPSTIGFRLVLTLTDVTFESSSEGFRWSGKNEDGGAVVLVGLRRTPKCCGQ